jgi:hypothetical protein
MWMICGCTIKTNLENQYYVLELISARGGPLGAIPVEEKAEWVGGESSEGTGGGEVTKGLAVKFRNIFVVCLHDVCMVC